MKNILNNFITFFTQSSEDPSKTSLTLNGLLVILAGYLQVNIAPFTPFIDKFIQTNLGHDIQIVFTAIVIISGWIVSAIGIGRKVANAIEKARGLRIE